MLGYKANTKQRFGIGLLFKLAFTSEKPAQGILTNDLVTE